MDNVNQDTTLNVLNQQLTNITAKNQFITALIGDEEYGIDIMMIQEIIVYKKPTRVSNVNPIIEGIINFWGRAIPFINMHKKFNLPSGKYGKYTVVVIIKIREKCVGLIVDKVLDIFSFEDEDIQMMEQEFAEDIKTKHIKGMGKLKGRIILLIGFATGFIF